MKRNLLEQILLYDYRYVIAHIVLIALALLAHFWRLGDLLPGLSFFEADYLSKLDFGSLLQDPLYWPHKLLTLAVVANWSVSIFNLRLVTVIFALLAVTAFYFLLKDRFRGRVAIITVGLLLSSSWWLSYARLARPEILIPLFVFLVMLLGKKAYETSQWYWLILFTITIGIAMYIPSLPYVLLIGALVTRSLIKQTWRGLKAPLKITMVVLMVIITVPLLVAIGRDLALLRELFLLPSSWPNPLDVGRAVVSNLAEIFWSREVFWPLGLGNLPHLDLFTAVMVALGLYHLDHEISRSLAQFVLVGLSGLLILVSLDSGPTDSIVLLPLLYTLIAAGIVMLLAQWYEIFPRNPIARLTAFIPTAFLLVCVVWYHQQRYFVAWPQTPEVVAEFPATASATTNLASQVDGIKNTRIIAANHEHNLMRAATLGQDGVSIESISSGLIPTDEQLLIVTPAAMAGFSQDESAALKRELNSVMTPSSSQPIAVWTNASN